MNKKIITIAEIVFALVFVVLLAVFMATINSKGNQANSQFVDTMDMTSGTSLAKYDTGDKVKGSDVSNTVTNFKTMSSDTKICVAVKTAGGTWTLYGYNVSTTDINGVRPGDAFKSYMANSTDDNYINASGDFQPAIIKNNNDVIVGVAFEQVPAGNTSITMETVLRDAKAVMLKTSTSP